MLQLSIGTKLDLLYIRILLLSLGEIGIFTSILNVPKMLQLSIWTKLDLFYIRILLLSLGEIGLVNQKDFFKNTSVFLLFHYCLPLRTCPPSFAYMYMYLNLVEIKIVEMFTSINQMTSDEQET